MESQGEQRRIVELELQQARYEASLAERRYAACDPDNRLIAAQLEDRCRPATRLSGGYVRVGRNHFHREGSDARARCKIDRTGRQTCRGPTTELETVNRLSTLTRDRLPSQTIA